jgi:CheY-like chemotaxis protein
LLERLIGYLLAHLEETWDPSLGALRLATSTAHLTREEALRRFPSQPLSFETDAVCLEIHDPSGTVRLEAPGEGFAFLPDHLLPFQGLSLSAVFRTVRDHQGAIEEVREPGHGSWIRLFFPVLAAQVDPRPSGEARASSGTILVVDDEDFLLTVTCDLLAELGFETLPASNGLQALELHAQHGPSIQLVLLDLNMPVMNGEETLRRLRAVDSQVKVLLCTGASAAIPFQDLQHLNLSGVLRKPYSYEDLRKVITEALSA